MNETKSLLNNLNYNLNRPTVLYVDGYTSIYSSETTQRIVDAYLERSDHNILVLDWSKYNGADYFWDAVPNMYKVAKVVATALIKMEDLEFDVMKFHLIGHSLGSHLVGAVGRSMITESKGHIKIERMTALDPAGMKIQCMIASK